MGFEPQGLWPFEPGLWRFINSKLHLSQSQRRLPKLCSPPMRHKRRGLCPPPQWRHTASFGVSARQIADNLETNFRKTPFCDYVPSAVKHLYVRVNAAEENIAEVPSVINAVWRKTFRITAKRRKSPHYRQRVRRQNKFTDILH